MSCVPPRCVCAPWSLPGSELWEDAPPLPLNLAQPWRVNSTLLIRDDESRGLNVNQSMMITGSVYTVYTKKQKLLKLKLNKTGFRTLLQGMFLFVLRCLFPI
jgi:hypothetical protein